MTVDGNSVTLEIVDTAGQDEYSTYQDQWMREGKGILLVYAIDNRNSFQAAQQFKEKIDRVKENEKVAIVLVGNKCDLESSRQVFTLVYTSILNQQNTS
jgi:GTPase KRas protein